jgi:hypothetical protein
MLNGYCGSNTLTTRVAIGSRLRSLVKVDGGNVRCDSATNVVCFFILKRQSRGVFAKASLLSGELCQRSQVHETVHSLQNPASLPVSTKCGSQFPAADRELIIGQNHKHRREYYCRRHQVHYNECGYLEIRARIHPACRAASSPRHENVVYETSSFWKRPKAVRFEATDGDELGNTARKGLRDAASPPTELDDYRERASHCDRLRGSTCGKTSGCLGGHHSCPGSNGFSDMDPRCRFEAEQTADDVLSRQSISPFSPGLRDEFCGEAHHPQGNLHAICAALDSDNSCQRTSMSDRCQFHESGLDPEEIRRKTSRGGWYG